MLSHSYSELDGICCLLFDSSLFTYFSAHPQINSLFRVFRLLCDLDCSVCNKLVLHCYRETIRQCSLISCCLCARSSVSQPLYETPLILDFNISRDILLWLFRSRCTKHLLLCSWYLAASVRDLPIDCFAAVVRNTSYCVLDISLPLCEIFRFDCFAAVKRKTSYLFSISRCLCARSSHVIVSELLARNTLRPCSWHLAAFSEIFCSAALLEQHPAQVGISCDSY